MVFKKGQVSNPNGRAKKPPEVAFAQKLSREFVQLRLTHFLRMPLDQLKKTLEDETNESVDHFIARIIVMGIIKGDHIRLNFMFDRLIGKVTEKVEISKPEPFIIEGVNGERIEMGVKDLK
jgi:hypothetical protein